jgi:hypothetical protein
VALVPPASSSRALLAPLGLKQPRRGGGGGSIPYAIAAKAKQLPRRRKREAIL